MTLGLEIDLRPDPPALGRPGGRVRPLDTLHLVTTPMNVGMTGLDPSLLGEEETTGWLG